LIIRIRNPNPRIRTSRLTKFNPSILINFPVNSRSVYKFLVGSLWNKIPDNPSSERYWLLNGIEYRTSPYRDDNINTYFCCYNNNRCDQSLSSETWWGRFWIASRFLKSCHDFPSQRPHSLPIQSCHGAWNRDTILGFPAITIWSQYTTSLIFHLGKLVRPKIHLKIVRKTTISVVTCFIEFLLFNFNYIMF